MTLPTAKPRTLDARHDGDDDEGAHVKFLRGTYRGLSRAADETQEHAHMLEGAVLRARQEGDEDTAIWYRHRADVARDIERLLRERMAEAQKAIGEASAYEEQDLRPLLRESISQARRKREQGAVRVYVAGASNPAELGRAELCMNEMRRLLGPDVITHDWIRDIKEAPCADFDLSDPACARYATNDVDAVEAADVIWLVVPSGPSTGAWVELGVALGLRRAAARKQLIVASGPDVRRSIFTRLCDELHEKDSDARDSITRFAAHRAAATGR